MDAIPKDWTTKAVTMFFAETLKCFGSEAPPGFMPQLAQHFNFNSINAENINRQKKICLGKSLM